MAGVVVAIDGLAKQRDLSHSGIDEASDFSNDFARCPITFWAYRVGNDAVGAAFIAAFHHCHKGGGASPTWLRCSGEKRRLFHVKDSPHERQSTGFYLSQQRG